MFGLRLFFTFLLAFSSLVSSSNAQKESFEALKPAVYYWKVFGQVEFREVELASGALTEPITIRFPFTSGTATLYSSDGKLLTAKHNLFFDEVQLLTEERGIMKGSFELRSNCSVWSAVDEDYHWGDYIFTGQIRAGKIEVTKVADTKPDMAMKLLDWRTYGDYVVLKIPVSDRKFIPPAERLQFGEIRHITATSRGHRVGGGSTSGKVEEICQKTLYGCTDYLQVNAMFEGGDSGGAAIDQDGNLLAIIVATDHKRKNVGYVVPVTSMKLP